MRRILITVSLAVAALVFAAAAGAATSPSYQVAGIEPGVQQDNVSAFAGVATGSTGDHASWQASVAHDPLSACSTVGSACGITGGTFALTSNNGSQMTGTFSGGSITLTAQAPGCGKQEFAVVASVWTDAGPQDFVGVLAQHRVKVQGQCRAILATVQGTLMESIGSF
jgi:hypothetical protein